MDRHSIFQQIANASPDWESWLAPDGSLRWVSAAVNRVAGHSVEACMSMPDYPQALLVAEDLPAFGLFQEYVAKREAGTNLLVRLRRKDGAVIWTTWSWQPFYGESGGYLGVRLSISDVSEGLHNRLLSARRDASMRVMREAMAVAGDIARVYRLVTECAAQTLGVARVGIWLLDEDHRHLVCADLFSRGGNCHDRGASIPVASCPRYIAAILGNQRVIVSDAMHDPVTRELADTYLKPLGIASMLDVPITDTDGTVGVLCLEHTGSRFFWSPAEISFAESLSDLLTLSLESDKRIRLEVQARHLASIVEAMPDPVVTIAQDGEVLYVNRATLKAQQRRDENGLPEFALDSLERFYSPAALKFRNEVILPAAMRDGCWSGETRVRTLAGAEVPVWQTMIVHRDADGAVKSLSSILHDLREQKKVEMQLRDREHALALLNAGLETRIAERTRELEAVNRNLEDFAYSVAHDLKAPLRGIDGYARLLREDYSAQLPGEAPEFVDNICSSAARMHQLIDDLLEYSRVGRRELSATTFLLRQVLERILMERRHEIEARNVQVVNQLGDIEITADLDCFLLLLRNLVDNAIKFTRDAAGPVVKVSATQDPRHTVICVQDNGCGFDMKYHDRIFSIFQRLHRLEDYPGTGIGLAIVGKSAERMGGRVWARSEPGLNTEFFVEMPR